MKKYIAVSSIVSIFVFFIACNNVTENSTNSPNANSGNPNDWNIPTSQVYDGGPGKDGIPALEDPKTVPASSVDYLDPNSLVIGVVINGEARAYPNMIIEHHEIVNDQIKSFPFSLTFCPLTGSAIGWNSSPNGTITTFGVQGFLYKNNLMPYDRETNSIWSQMGNQSVNGQLIGAVMKTFQVVETTWGTWRWMYPQTQVLSLDTGYFRNYGPPLYGDYNQNHLYILFPLLNDDTRLPRKERVHGVLEKISDNVSSRVEYDAKVYRFSSFSDEIGTINDSFKGKDIVVTGSQKYNFIVSFYRTAPDDNSILTFQPVKNLIPVVMRSDDGTNWDIWGNGVSGPREGQKLTPTFSYIAFWFAWGDFFPNAEIYDF